MGIIGIFFLTEIMLLELLRLDYYVDLYEGAA
jgi:hypothetical protein